MIIDNKNIDNKSMQSKNDLHPLLYNKVSKKNRYYIIFMLALSIWLVLNLLAFTKTAKADVWNYEAGFFKIHLSHLLQHTDKILNQEGAVLANPNEAGGFLQYSFISIGYNPTLQTELSAFLTLEKNKDEVGRPTPLPFADSFNINTLPQIIWEVNYGLFDKDVTPRLSFVYRMPIVKFFQKDHVLGLRFSLPIDTQIDTLTLISSTSTAVYFKGEKIISGGEISQKLEMYLRNFINATQLNLSLEGVYSSWYYLKGAIGLYYSFNQYNKIGLHYINNFLGKWVLPSQGVLFSLEYYFNPL